MAEFKKVETVVETGNTDVREFKTVTKTVETKESKKARLIAVLDSLPSNCDLAAIPDSHGNSKEGSVVSDPKFVEYLAKFGTGLPSGRTILFRTWGSQNNYYRITNGRCDLVIEKSDLNKLMEADLAM